MKSWIRSGMKKLAAFRAYKVSGNGVVSTTSVQVGRTGAFKKSLLAKARED